MRRVWLWSPFSILVLIFCGIASADETPVYTYPEIEPDIFLGTGYRSVAPSSHPSSAAEYEDLRSSAIASGNILLFPFPQRLHFEFDVTGPRDYFGDLSYAYGDILLLRWIKRSLHHNLGRIELIDLDPSTTSPGVDVRDGGRRYGVDFTLDTVSLRLKPFGYPFHLFFNGMFVNKYGEVQQLFRSGSYPDITRASEARRIDWHTNIIDYGSNVHLGPVELEFSHEDKWFLSGGQRVMTEYYDASSTRTAGFYPHNLVPDLTGHTDTLRMHSSYTGAVTVSGSIAQTERYNESSGAQEQILEGGASVFVRPIDYLSFALNYHHLDTDVDNPNTLRSGYLGYAAYTSPITGIKDSMSTSSDEYSAIARWNASRWVTFSADYNLKATQRTDSWHWDLPSQTTKGSETLAASGRLPWHLNWKAAYTHTDMDNPAYNTDSDHADQGTASITWSPLGWLSGSVSYLNSRGVRDNLNFEASTAEADNRLLQRQQLTCSLSMPVTEKVALSGGYALFTNRVRQDMVYGSSTTPATLIYDDNVRYTDQANSYFGSVTYMPIKKLNITGSVNYTVSVAHYLPEDGLLTSYSEVGSEQTTYRTTVGYEFYHGWNAGLEVAYSNFNNLVRDAKNPYLADGHVTDVYVKLSKKW